MSLTLLLRCHDLDATRGFYRALPGFSVSDSADATLTVTQASATLIFTAADLWGAPPAFTGTLYFSVADVDAVFAAIGTGVTVAWPPQDMPYGGREFGIRDCNGYHLAFRRA